MGHRKDRERAKKGQLWRDGCLQEVVARGEATEEATAEEVAEMIKKASEEHVVSSPGELDAFLREVVGRRLPRGGVILVRPGGNE